MTRHEWWLWAVAFVLLQAGDVATTVVGLGRGYPELNPLMAALMPGGWLLVKAAATALVLWLGWGLVRLGPGRVLWLAVAGYCCVVANNLVMVT